MEFRIETTSKLPIYRQLRNQFREAVARGKLKPEQRLPSVRALSRTLVVNPNTIARVYTELEREGLLHTRPGLGVFVASLKSEFTKKVRKDKFRELLDEFLTDAVHLGLSASEVSDEVSSKAKQFQWQTEK